MQLIASTNCSQKIIQYLKICKKKMTSVYGNARKIFEISSAKIEIKT